ncbi:NEW3 domain-containing protein [Paraflavitalea sp. CAU 1676]|uniref:COG1470 family protein n=1 Tax=Paraflavitalea sp. CAU 1676 TaxID=3032598 RepID=UPI0023DCCBB0|nr:NEW3 domain-containing protein [Paraflavitalea sp. CAU 1676]MDF2188334.1 NEW3 domain-containing protein [Paraflavitalea sp. CAU 1676]
MQGRRLLRPLLVSAIIFSLFSFIPPSRGKTSPSNPSTLTARLINLEGTAKETFRFNASLHNARSQATIYTFHAAIPSGWNLAFRVDGMLVTSFKADSGRTQDIGIELTAMPDAKPGTYSIPVTAIGGADTLLLNLEAVVKGSYALELTTPTGLLSGEITEGNREPIHLTLKNTGTLPLEGLELSAQAPTKWDAIFEPAKVERLEPGKSIDVVANLKVPDKTIAGDYVTTFTARNNNSNASALFRMTVTTSWLAGWMGVVVILAAVGIIYTLIKKYGRR